MAAMRAQQRAEAAKKPKASRKSRAKIVARTATSTAKSRDVKAKRAGNSHSVSKGKQLPVQEKTNAVGGGTVAARQGKTKPAEALPEKSKNNKNTNNV